MDDTACSRNPNIKRPFSTSRKQLCSWLAHTTGQWQTALTNVLNGLGSLLWTILRGISSTGGNCTNEQVNDNDV